MHILKTTQPKLKDTDMKKEVMAEEKESIYDKIRREAREKQDAERERRARVREVMEKGNTSSWLQRLKR
jgi:hypothetical protein